MNFCHMANTYKDAKEQYAKFGVDTEKAIQILDSIPLSMHCWQGDDVCGFETPDAGLSGDGIQATGNYPGKARNPDELRADIDEAVKYIPGKIRLNLPQSTANSAAKRLSATKSATKISRAG